MWGEAGPKTTIELCAGHGIKPVSATADVLNIWGKQKINMINANKWLIRKTIEEIE